MLNDFQASFKAILDVSEISKQVTSLQNNIKKTGTLKLNLEFDNSSIDVKTLNDLLSKNASNAGSNAGQSFAKSINSSLNKIHLVNGGIGNIKNILQGAGFDTKSINSVTQGLDKMVLTINKVKTAQLKDGDIKMTISGVDELGRAVNIVRTFDKETGRIINTTKSFSQSFSETVKGISTSAETLTKSATLSNNIKAWMNDNAKAAEKFGDELKELQGQLSNNQSPETLRQISLRFAQIKSEAKASGLVTNKFAVSLKDTAKQLLGLTSAAAVIQKAIQFAKEMYQEVYKIDTAMVNLKKVTDETDTSYSKFLSRSTKSAKELGSTVSDLITQTSEWAKLGYSLSEAEELSKISSIYMNVGEVDAKTSVSDMVTALKAFDISASDAEHIIDIYNELGNNFAISSAKLGEGISNSASALALAGADIEESSAMITGIAEITQDASEAGNALKIFSMRVRGMKGELEELGEEVDGNIESISKVQTQILNLTDGRVNIFDDSGEFRNYYDIMKDVADIYDDLTSTEQASLSEILFGKQRGNAGAALIQSFQNGQIEKAYQSAVNSMGSAYAEQEKWMDSLEAKTKQFEAAFQELSVTIMDSDVPKGLIDAGTTLLSVLTKIIDNIDIIDVALIGFAAHKGIKSIS